MRKTILLLALLLMAACGPDVPTPVGDPNLLPDDTQPPTNTPQGSTLDEAADPEREPNVVIDNVSLSIDSSQFEFIDTAQVAAVEEGPNLQPRSRQIVFGGWPGGDGEFQRAQIDIFEAQEYRDLLADTGVDYFGEIEAAIESGISQAEPGTGLFTPGINASPMFTVRQAPLFFQNGRGLRYVTQFSQALTVIHNAEGGLVYVFQGFTDDGQFYVRATFPLNHPSLPDTPQVPEGQDEATFFEPATYDPYLTGVIDTLQSADEGSYTPELAFIDGILETLTVTTPE